MSETKLILEAYLKDNRVHVKLYTGSEALLALTLRKIGLTIDDFIIGEDIKKSQSEIQIPKTILSKLG